MSANNQNSQTLALWPSIKEALAGTHRDYTSGSLNRAILLLAIPMVLEMLLESLFAVVDVFWVAHLGSNAVATVGLTESMLTIVFAVGIGLSLSTTAMVARRTGEKDREGAAIAAVQAIGIGIVFCAVIGIPCWFTAGRLLHLMGASGEIVAVGSSYAKVVLGGCGVVLLLFLNNAVFRGAGDAAIAMRVLFVSNVLNMILDPCLIFGRGPFPRMGVTGAAVATLTGRSFGVVYQLFMLHRGSEHIRIVARHLRMNLAVMSRLIRVSFSGIVQFLLAQSSWLVLVRIISLFGSAAVAGYTIGIRIIIFAILPAWGLSNAAATLVGQNLGAQRPERSERAVWVTSSYTMLFLGAIGVFFLAFDAPVIKLFTQDATVVPQAVMCLRILSYGNVAYAYAMVMLQAFNGAGDTRTPLVVNFFAYWVLEIPLAYVLAVHLKMETVGVYIAILVAEVCIAVTSTLLFKRGRWKMQKI